MRLQITQVILVICCLMGGTFVLCEEVEEMFLIADQIKTISCLSPTRVVISKPEICDVISVSETEIVLSPKSAGVTTFFFWDKLGEHAFKIRVVPEDLKEIKRRIDSFLEEMGLKKVYTKISEIEGRVLLLGEVKTCKDKELLDTTLGALKAHTIDLIKIKERALVEIDVQVLELTEEAAKKLGFTWPGSLTIGETTEPIKEGCVGHPSGRWDKLWRITPWSRSKFFLTLKALISEGKARVLSRPKLVTLSGKEAKLTVGGEVPIVVISAGVGAASVEYKEYGIVLNIKPIVEEKDKIYLAIKTEVSDIEDYIKEAYYLVYPFTKRIAETELYVEDGQTLYIGGLIAQKTKESLSKVPWLAEVPILGAFFRSRSTTRGKDLELFITLTPTIVSGREEVVEEAALRPEELPEIISPIYESIPHPLRGYVYTLKKKILYAVTYPKLAREAGFEGIVKLSLHILSDGRLQEVLVKESSGYRVLDDAACEAAKKISPSPEFPPQTDLKELWIDIPIVFRQD